MSLLVCDAVSKWFGGVKAVSDVSVSLDEGPVYGLIGPNGAGKTTLFNILTGALEPSEGCVRFMGSPIGGEQPHRIARRGIARTYQNIRLFGNMTVEENVAVAQNQRLPFGGVRSVFWRGGSAEAELADNGRRLLELMGLWEKRGLMSGDLSYGDQRRLEIARACAMDPKLLLLDEPAAGMNEAETRALWSRIEKIRSAGTTVFLVDHDMDLVMERCDHVFVLNFGELIAEGRPGDLRRNEAVVEAYLGREDG